MRRALTMIALATLATGCTTTTEGIAAPAPTLGHAPKPIAANALTEVLLDTGEINTVMGTNGMTKVGSGDDMLSHRIADMDCLPTWGGTEQSVYGGTRFLGVRRQQFRESLDKWDHIVFQAVVGFPDGLAAHDVYTAQVSSWGECNNRTFNDRQVGDPDAHGTDWSLNAAAEKDGVLTILRSQVNGRGWACQRALSAANNVVIDVETCADDIGDQGVQLARLIAEKISAKP